MATTEPMTDEEGAALIRALRVYDMELEKLAYMTPDVVSRDWINRQRLALRRGSAKLGGHARGFTNWHQERRGPA